MVERGNQSAPTGRRAATRSFPIVTTGPRRVALALAVSSEEGADIRTETFGAQKKHSRLYAQVQAAAQVTVIAKQTIGQTR